MSLTPEQLKDLSDKAVAALKELRQARAWRSRQEEALKEAREKEEGAQTQWEKAASDLKAAVDGEAVEDIMES